MRCVANEFSGRQLFLVVLSSDALDSDQRPTVEIGFRSFVFRLNRN